MQNSLGYGIIEHIELCLPIDLIVLDIMLNRNISGYDIYDQLQKNCRLQGIPAIAVTPETETPKAKALGMNGFIGKPINTLQFADLLARVISSEKVWVVGR